MHFAIAALLYMCKSAFKKSNLNIHIHCYTANIVDTVRKIKTKHKRNFLHITISSCFTYRLTVIDLPMACSLKCIWLPYFQLESSNGNNFHRWIRSFTICIEMYIYFMTFKICSMSGFRRVLWYGSVPITYKHTVTQVTPDSKRLTVNKWETMSNVPYSSAIEFELRRNRIWIFIMKYDGNAIDYRAERIFRWNWNVSNRAFFFFVMKKINHQNHLLGNEYVRVK